MTTRDDLIAKYTAIAAGHRANAETLTGRERGQANQKATIAEKRVAQLEAFEVVPNEFWRERFLRLSEVGQVTLTSVAQQVGISGEGKADTSYLGRLLGITQWTNKHGYPKSTSDTLPYELAVKLADALGVPVHQVDEDPDPALTARPRFRSHDSVECDYKGCDEPVADPSVPRFTDPSCRGGMCEPHADLFARLRVESEDEDERNSKKPMRRRKRAVFGRDQAFAATAA